MTRKKPIAFTEAATEGILSETVFLEISQNSQENTCVSFLIKLQAETFFTEYLRATASAFILINHTIDCNQHCTVNGIIL